MAEEFFHVLGENDTIIRFKKNDKQELRHVDTVKAIKAKGNKSLPAPAELLPLEDKLSFVLGLLLLLLLQFLILRHPHLVPHAYTLVLIGLLSLRVPLFIKEKCGLFLIDFCYFINASTIIQLFLYPENTAWFQTNYVLSMGCLMNAMVVWQNSLMLHSLDRLTSLLLHALAPLTLHVLRWEGVTVGVDSGLGVREAAILPLLLYTVWQAAYLVITELLLAGWLQRDPEQSSSLRHLASDSSNGVHQLVVSLLRGAGVMAREEVFDADTLKTKLTMVGAQLVYTVLTLLPVTLLYSSYTASLLYMSCIYLAVLWRAASTYMEDWAEKRGVTLVGPLEAETEAALVVAMQQLTQ